MKKAFSLLLVLGFCNTIVKSQEGEAVKDTTWKAGGVASINMTQAYYENWTAGGVPSVAGVAFLKAYIDYNKGKWKWENDIDLAYGLINEREKLMRKTDDKIQFDSKLGYNMKNAWYASALLSFRTQFTEGWQDPELQQVKISDFMSPAYLIFSLGFDFNPNEKFSFFISPIASKTTIVLDQDLADKGAFGVEGKEVTYVLDDTTVVDSVVTPGKNYRPELGAQLKLRYKTKVWTNVDFMTRLELFTNYFENFGNIDVNWEGLLEMKVNDYLSANIRVELIYDDDIDILTGVDDEGVEQFGPRLQVKQLFGLGLSYKF